MHLIRRLHGCDRGATIVEMGLGLPLILTLGLGGLETARYVLTVLRMNQIAYAVADNAGRVRQALDESDVNDIMVGGKLMGGSDFAANGRIILSDLEQRTTTTNTTGLRQWIRWQRCAGALNKPSSYGGPIDANGAAVTNLSNTTNVDHGAVETMSTITGMGPAGQQISAAGGTAVMVVEVFYTYRPIVPFFSFASRALRVFEAFNIRQRTDFSIYNASGLTGTQRADCTLFDASVPAV